MHMFSRISFGYSFRFVSFRFFLFAAVEWCPHWRKSNRAKCGHHLHLFHQRQPQWHLWCDPQNKKKFETRYVLMIWKLWHQRCDSHVYNIFLTKWNSLKYFEAKFVCSEPPSNKEFCHLFVLFKMINYAILIAVLELVDMPKMSESQCIKLCDWLLSDFIHIQNIQWLKSPVNGSFNLVWHAYGLANFIMFIIYAIHQQANALNQSRLINFICWLHLQKTALAVKKKSEFSQTKSLDFDAQSKREYCIYTHKRLCLFIFTWKLFQSIRSPHHKLYTYNILTLAILWIVYTTLCPVVRVIKNATRAQPEHDKKNREKTNRETETKRK